MFFKISYSTVYIASIFSNLENMKFPHRNWKYYTGIHEKYKNANHQQTQKPLTEQNQVVCLIDSPALIYGLQFLEHTRHVRMLSFFY